MALLISADDVRSIATAQVAIDAMRTAFKDEAAGRATLPRRLDAPTSTGFIRMMPAVLDEVMGGKIMTLVEGVGTRYLVLLYSVTTGELLALIDADELTKIRTAATTALAGVCMVSEPPQRLAVLGTGFEARGHVELLSHVWDLDEIVVHSRSAANRERFAERVTATTGVAVRCTDTAREALQSSTTVLLATKSTSPVLDGNDLLPGSVVLSIGSTRPDLRELDTTSLARAVDLVVDSVDAVRAESGDIIAAIECGALPVERIVPLAELTTGTPAPQTGDDVRTLHVFKSVGTALQDLALARAVHHVARRDGVGTDIGDVTRLKPFTS